MVWIFIIWEALTSGLSIENFALPLFQLRTLIFDISNLHPSVRIMYTLGLKLTKSRTFSKSCRNPFEIFFLVIFKYNLIFRQIFRNFSKFFDDWWFLTPRSDPEKDLTGWAENDRGVSFVFGPDVVQHFLRKFDMDLIVRAHQVVEDGYEFF